MPTSVATKKLGSRPGVSRTAVQRRGDVMLQILGLDEAELSVLLCDDDTIAELNASYRDKPKATDVLAFPLREDFLDGSWQGSGSLAQALEQPFPLGDVVISLPTAARQAGSDSLRLEVTRLLAHGLLHLVGWDHDEDRRRMAMEAETERLIAAAQRGAPQ